MKKHLVDGYHLAYSTCKLYEMKFRSKGNPKNLSAHYIFRWIAAFLTTYRHCSKPIFKKLDILQCYSFINFINLWEYSLGYESPQRTSTH